MFKLNELYNKFTMSMKHLIYIIVLFSFSLCDLKVGDLAPYFTLEDQNGKFHTLKEYQGQNIVLYFYPKDFTPGCTKQACSLRDINIELANRNAIVLGLSYDSNKKHEGFVEKHQLNFTLLSDSDKSISKLYDANGWLFPKRKTFIINEDGIIKHIIDSVDITNHNSIILSVLDSLQSNIPK